MVAHRAYGRGILSSFFSDLLGTLFDRNLLRSSGDDGRAIEAICAELISVHGEVTGVKDATAVLSRYHGMNEAEKTAFFDYLTEMLDVDSDAIAAAVEAYREEPDRANYSKLMQVSEPLRQELLRRLNQVPGATAALVQMRVDLLRMLKDKPEYGRTDADFRHMFGSWFNRGFLVMRRISWETPANILEKIIQYEAVHAINDWDDLRGRMQPSDRRCYAFFHPVMPEEPLIFVEVALTRGIPNSIQTILKDKREVLAPHQANTAVFYSISNCQTGLKGISFGNSLIKQVAADLAAEMPQLKSFVTLSPVPGFGRWLESVSEDEAIGRIANAILKRSRQDLMDGVDAEEIRMLVARYLVEEKRKDGLPLDPVARFHLGNGAQLFDIHARADVSAKGVATARGAMVNYLYDLGEVAENHEAFVNEKKIVASKPVRQLVRALGKRGRELKSENA